MATPVIMPALDVTKESGKLLSWLKKEGDHVAKGEPVLEVETDKAVVEVEAASDGILSGVQGVAGQVYPFGATVAWLLAEGEAVPQPAAGKAVAQVSAPAAAQPATAVPQAGSTSRPSGRMSPKARMLAKELGVDVAAIQGSGPGGEILAEDVRTAAAGVGSRSGAQEQSTLTRIAGERTTQGWTTIPHIFVSREVDADALVSYREQQGAQSSGVKPSVNDVLLALTARVLRKHPLLNAQWSKSGVHHQDEIHVGIAIAVGEAVVAGVVHKADELPLAQVAERRQLLAERAKANRLQPDDYSGATFTVSNLGMFGVDAFTAIIVPPQVATLAVGTIKDCVVARDGKPAVRPMMNLTLSLDHRIGGGATAALFLADLAEAIANPGAQL